MKQYYNPEEAKQFLDELQIDLLKDRQEEECTASPLYYGIMDNNPTVTAEGYDDFITFHNPESCESVDTLEEVIQIIKDEDNLDKFIENTAAISCYEPEELYDNKNNKILINDMYVWEEALEDFGWHIIYMKDSYHIKENFIALTRKAAKEHLTNNSHHYTKDAHTYAMCSWRSPQFENLIALLHQIDWKDSNIQLRIPYTECYAELELDIYLNAYIDLCKFPNNDKNEVKKIIYEKLHKLPHLSKNNTSYWLQNEVKYLVYTEVSKFTSQIPSATIDLLHLTDIKKIDMIQPETAGTINVSYIYEKPRYKLYYRSTKTHIFLKLTEYAKDVTDELTLTHHDFLKANSISLTNPKHPKNKNHIIFYQKIEKGD